MTDSITNPLTILIIGAGPAGAHCARELAVKGYSVILMDHRAPWEKPCGGLFPERTMRLFPQGRNYDLPDLRLNFVHIESPREAAFKLEYGEPFHSVSRRDLAEHLLNGDDAPVPVSDRADSIERHGLGWKVKGRDREYFCDILIGADGAASLVRRSVLVRIPDEHMCTTFGYFLGGMCESVCLLKYSDFLGYIWIISCHRHTSAGILARKGSLQPREMYARLDAILADRFPKAIKLKRYAALLPSVSDPSFFDAPCCGENWALLGDAAGHVDPIIGEGIYFAMMSGKLAAQAILSGNLRDYDRLWRESYGEELKTKAAILRDMLALSRDLGPEMYGAMMYNLLAGQFGKEG